MLVLSTHCRSLLGAETGNWKWDSQRLRYISVIQDSRLACFRDLELCGSGRIDQLELEG